MLFQHVTDLGLHSNFRFLFQIQSKCGRNVHARNVLVTFRPCHVCLTVYPLYILPLWHFDWTWEDFVTTSNQIFTETRNRGKMLTGLFGLRYRKHVYNMYYGEEKTAKTTSCIFLQSQSFPKTISWSPGMARAVDVAILGPGPPDGPIVTLRQTICPLPTRG